MAQSLKQQEWKKNHYKNNLEYFRVKQQNRRVEIRELVNSLKTPCIVCGENDKCCIDFHHLNPEEKDFEIGDAGKHKWGNKKIIEEINKCVCLCSNHHKKLHFYDLTVDDLLKTSSD